MCILQWVGAWSQELKTPRDFLGFNFEGCSHWANKLFSLSLRSLNLKIGIVMGSNLYCYKKKVPKFKNLKKTYTVTKTRRFQSLGNTLPFLCFAYIGTHCYRGSYLASESCSTQNARKFLLFCRSWQSVQNIFVLPQVIQSYRLSSLSVLPTVSLMQMSIPLLKKVGKGSLVIHDRNVQALCWMFKWVFPVCVKCDSQIYIPSSVLYPKLHSWVHLLLGSFT